MGTSYGLDQKQKKQPGPSEPYLLGINHLLDPSHLWAQDGDRDRAANMVWLFCFIWNKSEPEAIKLRRAHFWSNFKSPFLLKEYIAEKWNLDKKCARLKSFMAPGPEKWYWIS